MKYLRIKRMETVGRMAAYFLREEESFLLQKVFQAYPSYSIDEAV
jgi:hypothetical protein